MVEIHITISDVTRQVISYQLSNMLQVYVDYFFNAATKSKDGTHMTTIIRESVHNIHIMFLPTYATVHDSVK